jgi:hypothetical protein
MGRESALKDLMLLTKDKEPGEAVIHLMILVDDLRSEKAILEQQLLSAKINNS